MVRVKINDISVNFKIDTGAQFNVITEKLCKEAGIKNISKSTSRLISYSKDEVKTIGKSHVALEYKQKYHDAVVHVVDYDVVPVLGLQTCLDLELVQRVNLVDENQSTASTDSDKYFQELDVCLENMTSKRIQMLHLKFTLHEESHTH